MLVAFSGKDACCTGTSSAAPSLYFACVISLLGEPGVERCAVWRSTEGIPWEGATADLQNLFTRFNDREYSSQIWSAVGNRHMIAPLGKMGRTYQQAHRGLNLMCLLYHTTTVFCICLMPKFMET